MTNLLILSLIVVGVYGTLTLLNATVPSVQLSRAFRGRVGLSFMFIFTAVGHFLMPVEMAKMLPSFIPLRVEIIYLTGVLEILGAIGLLIPGLERLSSMALILFLVGILPANIYSSLNSVAFGGNALGPAYLLVRVPFQLFLIGWAYYFGIKLTSEQQPWNRSIDIATYNHYSL